MSQKKISVLLEREAYERFCQFCYERGYKKSTLISRLIRDFMREQKYPTEKRLSKRTTTKDEERD